jgi:hypothetical protein
LGVAVITKGFIGVSFSRVLLSMVSGITPWNEVRGLMFPGSAMESRSEEGCDTGSPL